MIAITLLASCAKDELVVVPGNVPPPDPTVTDLSDDVLQENYINKVYISVLGRKPTSIELTTGKTILSQHDLSVADRNQLLDVVLSGNEYYYRVYDLARIELLNAVDTSEITQDIFIYNLLLQDTATYGPYFALIHHEIDRLEALKEAPSAFAAGNIDIIELHRRCANNKIYDDINMGTENFVISMFQNFLLRYPTTQELEQGKQMVDGFTAAVFYETGDSKDDFLDIFFRSSDYFEGQVRNLYLRYLFREPDSETMTALSQQYKKDKDYKALQKAILNTDEFVGLK